MQILQSVPKDQLHLFIKKEGYPLSEEQVSFVIAVEPAHRANLLGKEIITSFVRSCRNASDDFQKCFNEKSIYINYDLQKIFIESRDEGNNGVFLLRKIISQDVSEQEYNEILQKADLKLSEFVKDIKILENKVKDAIKPERMKSGKKEQGIGGES